MISIASVLSAMLMTASAPASSLPNVEALFRCPLEVAQSDFEPPEHWSRVPAPALGLSVRVPTGWSVDQRPGRLEVTAPDQSIRVSVRRGERVDKKNLAAVRRALEASELGASFVHESCAERVTVAIANESPWNALSFGVYGRPLGERRRRVALFGGLDDGSMAAVVSTRWKRGQTGPDWPTVWRLLGGLRVEPRGAGDKVARLVFAADR